MSTIGNIARALDLTAKAITISSSLTPGLLLQVLGKISVEERNGIITVKGFKTDLLLKAMAKQWGTTVIGKHIFKEQSSRGVSFYSFFALEIYYIVEKLISENVFPPGYRSVFNRLLHELKENTWISGIDKETKNTFDYDALNIFKKKPLHFQSDFFSVYDDKTKRMGLNGYLLSANAGSGKTIASLMAMAGRGKDLVVVFCPKPALAKPWEETFETEFHKTPKYWTTLSKEPLESVKDYDYIVVHYEAIPKLLPFIKELKSRNVGFILDECHNFNDPKSERSGNLLRIIEEVGSTDNLPMSGTPVKSMAVEVFVVLKMLDPLFTKEVGEAFKKIFGVSTARGNDIMRRRLGMISFVIEKPEEIESSEIDYKVSFEGSNKYTLPELKVEMKNFINERLTYYKENNEKYTKQYYDAIEVFKQSLTRASPKELELFKQYQEDVKLISKTRQLNLINDILVRCNAYERKVIQPKLSGDTLKRFKNSKSVVKYVTLKVRGEALGRILGRRRAECHVDMVAHAKLENFVKDARKKTLIFTHYVDVVRELTRYFSTTEMKEHFSPISVFQETSGKLPQLVKAFYEKEKENPMIATYDTLSTAVPLTAASTVILFNQPFRNYEREQAIARARRRGQDGPVTVVNVILDTGDIPNISTRSQDIMQWSKEQVEEITGVTLSDSTDKSVGLEELIDKQEIALMQQDQTTRSVEQQQADVLALVASTESFTEQEFMDNVVPSLEGIFDTAMKRVKDLFNVFNTKAIDRERVEVFRMSGELLKVIRHTNYGTLADTYVMRPEGLNVTFIQFADEMGKQFIDIGHYFETSLRPINQFLAQLASDPGKIGSIVPGEFNRYLKEYDLTKAKQGYQSCFKSDQTVTAKYHQMFSKNEDWKTLEDKLQLTNESYLKISPEKIEESVNSAYDMIEDIARRLKSDEELRKLSKVQIRDLSTLAYSMASCIEYYSVLMFSWRVLNQSLRETEKNIIHAAQRGFGNESLGIEGFGDTIKDFYRNLKHGKKPDLDKINDISKQMEELKKTYLNDAWLNNRGFKTEDIPLDKRLGGLVTTFMSLGTGIEKYVYDAKAAYSKSISFNKREVDKQVAFIKPFLDFFNSGKYKKATEHDVIELSDKLSRGVNEQEYKIADEFFSTPPEKVSKSLSVKPLDQPDIKKLAGPLYDLMRLFLDSWNIPLAPAHKLELKVEDHDITDDEEEIGLYALLDGVGTYLYSITEDMYQTDYDEKIHDLRQALYYLISYSVK